MTQNTHAPPGIARLHGEACYDCGAVSTTLYPDGRVIADGTEWEIAKCIVHRQLSDDQKRGAACVHCGRKLDNRTAIDLGQRWVVRDGISTSWYPRACPPHGALP